MGGLFITMALHIAGVKFFSILSQKSYTRLFLGDHMECEGEVLKTIIKNLIINA